MIIGILNSFFGGRPAATSGEAAPLKQELNSDAKDELVQEPRLSAEDGFTYTREMGRRFNPSSPELKAESLEHLWAGNSLQNNVRSDLDRLQTKIRSQKEESLTSLETSRGIIRLDSETQDYRYFPTSRPVVTGTDYSSHTIILRSGEFEISEQGALKLPSASSDANPDERNFGLQVQKALDWANAVRSEADYRVDGFESDHDPRPGHTVASKLDEYWFLKKADLPHLEHQTYSLQSGPDGTRLFEDSYGKKPKLLLAVTEDEKVMSLQMSTDELGKHSLHLLWKKDTASILAEIRQEQGYLPAESAGQYAEKKGRTPANFYSHDQVPTAWESRDGLANDFSKSDRLRSHGGGHHVLVTASGPFPNDQTYPEKFQDQESGKSYHKTSYKKHDGSYLYVEDLT